jgi:hypothetical protein
VKLTITVGILLILLFVGLPIVTGYAHIPEDLSPASLERFLGEILAFWLRVLKNMLIELERF